MLDDTPPLRVGVFTRTAFRRDRQPGEAAAQPELAALLRCELAAIARRRALRVISLDVFDTLLLRNDKCEARRFWELSELLAGRLRACVQRRVPVADLFFARGLAMRAAYACGPVDSGCREGRIADIVATQLDLLALPGTLRRVFLDAEFGYETANLAANRLLYDSVRTLFPGLPVIGLSDMYLGGQDIAQLLVAVSAGTMVLDAIYSSADLVLNKRSGLAYGRIAALLQVAPAQILHIGDDERADFLQARLAGAAALLYPVAHAAHSRRHDDLERFVAERQRDGLDVAGLATL